MVRGVETLGRADLVQHGSKDEGGVDGDQVPGKGVLVIIVEVPRSCVYSNKKMKLPLSV